MNKRSFRWLVGVSAASFCGGFAVMLALDEALPPELGSWVKSDLNSAWGHVDTFWAIILASSLIATVGLLFFAGWSRWLYAAATVAGLVVTLFSGPEVSTAFESFFSSLTLLLDGFIICAAFFSDVRFEFDGRRTGHL